MCTYMRLLNFLLMNTLKYSVLKMKVCILCDEEYEELLTNPPSVTYASWISLRYIPGFDSTRLTIKSCSNSLNSPTGPGRTSSSYGIAFNTDLALIFKISTTSLGSLFWKMCIHTACQYHLNMNEASLPAHRSTTRLPTISVWQLDLIETPTLVAWPASLQNIHVQTQTC